MSESGSDRDSVERLAEEFLARFRRGERPALSEYTDRYPVHAAEIRELFAAVDSTGPSEGTRGTLLNAIENQASSFIGPAHAAWTKIVGGMYAVVFAAAVPADENAPNILYIMADDHAAHAGSAYGSKVNRTHPIDRPAKDGMRFT
jgi:hypothetical protein